MGEAEATAMTEESEKIMKLLREKREEILAAAARHGARNVRIFGSVARGEAGPDSDIDFLVEMESGRSLFDLIDLEDDIAAVVNRRFDLVTEGGLNRYMKDEVLAQAVGV
jgi:predicted nucleotidyltransferase